VVETKAKAKRSKERKAFMVDKEQNQFVWHAAEATS
jgi:hypothetical protein